MGNTKLIKGLFAIVASATAGLVFPTSSSFGREYTPDDSKEASGYAAGKGCAGGMEGPNEAANPAAGKPQDKTWEDRGARPVMVAVPPSESSIMSALCPGRALGARIEAGDLCPICEQLSRLDFSHKECKDMGTTSGPILIEWECPEAGKKYPEEVLKPRHEIDAQDRAAQDKPEISCEDPEQAGGQVEYCTQNRFFKQKAEECLRQIDRAWQQAAPELAALLEGNKDRTFTHQNSELRTTENDYTRTRKKIRALIAATKEAEQKLARYPALMVDNLKHTKPSCFRENKEAIQAVVDEIDGKIDQGLMALNEAEKLNIAANGRAEGLVGKYGYIQAPDFSRKKQKEKFSDITGLKEDREKRLQNTQGKPLIIEREEELSQDLASTRFARRKFPRKESDITKSARSPFVGADGSGNVLQREIDPSGNFSPRGSLSRAISSSQSGRRNSDNKESVGATLWDTDISGGMKLAVETLKNDSELVISAEAAPSGKPTLSPIVQAEPMEDMRREADPVPAGKPAATAETTSSFGGTRVPASAPGEAAGERDLFQRISFRYRTTELFRMQKAGEIPDSPSSFAKR